MSRAFSEKRCMMSGVEPLIVRFKKPHAERFGSFKTIVRFEY
jgi:hypothetical protein